MTNMILRPDAKGRISLGDLAHNVSSYRMTVEESGNIILEPYIEIPFADKWIFEDKALINKLKQETREKQT